MIRTVNGFRGMVGGSTVVTVFFKVYLSVGPNQGSMVGFRTLSIDGYFTIVRIFFQCVEPGYCEVLILLALFNGTIRITEVNDFKLGPTTNRVILK